MHELSIAADLLRNVLAVAAEHEAVRIEQVTIEVGVLRQVVPEAIVEAFAMLAVGTAAEGAALKVTELPARAECRRCGNTYAVSVDVYVCPQCGQADARLVDGNDILLQTVVCQT
ncbi:MAG: hydrogenase maturation nickel metallochaperone HypA [Planctomycetes bacterium]|nr:hydrogenase maturation nickel metallochaperone HypA [Planctomycetota bacterium]